MNVLSRLNFSLILLTLLVGLAAPVHAQEKNILILVKMPPKGQVASFEALPVQVGDGPVVTVAVGGVKHRWKNEKHPPKTKEGLTVSEIKFTGQTNGDAAIVIVTALVVKTPVTCETGNPEVLEEKPVATFQLKVGNSLTIKQVEEWGIKPITLEAKIPG
ncbi:MAG TPA: hypothetical protein PLB18_06880 [Acidobacteriota bacterium]|nr:hypothetical protein [Acidobacteriota bacterium]HND19078.1 hypothetical protein [Acidobacteriota bacterium]HNG92832.1 hypothetical protein [Acidobacteriota bacterium]HNH80963.1 hypothetical protein [Acidobacteriota bacterium]